MAEAAAAAVVLVAVLFGFAAEVVHSEEVAVEVVVPAIAVQAVAGCAV